MNKDFLDKASEFVKDNNLVMCGVILLVAVFLTVFFLKTFWGEWKARTKKEKD